MQFVHLDTSSTKVSKVNSNPFQCTIPFVNQMRRVSRVILKTVEIPVAFYNVRTGLNTFVLGGAATYTVPPGNYNTTTLITALNTAVAAVNVTFSANTTTNRISVSQTGATTLTFGAVTPGSLLYMLGIKQGDIVPVTGSTYTASLSYNLNPDTMVNIWIRNLYTSSSENSAITFKVPIQGVNGTVFYFSDNADFSQYINVTDPSMILDRLDIEVRDRYGKLLDNNGVDWSFTLGLEFLR
jgi:hypothetical protein